MQRGSLFLRVIASAHRSSSLNLKSHRVTTDSTAISLKTLFFLDHRRDQLRNASNTITTFDISSRLARRIMLDMEGFMVDAERYFRLEVLDRSKIIIIIAIMVIRGVLKDL